MRTQTYLPIVCVERAMIQRYLYCQWILCPLCSASLECLEDTLAKPATEHNHNAA
jgi:hypothetical protein